MSLRTLWNWEHIAEDQRRPVGRPPHSFWAFKKCLYAVARALRSLGYHIGEWALVKLLGAEHSRTLIRRALSALKARRKKRKKSIVKKQRLTIEPLERDVLWSLDATHMGRCRGKSMQAQLVVDPFSINEITLSFGLAPITEDAVKIMEEAKRVRGQYPLVLVTDNGTQYTSKKFERFLKLKGVQHLVNLPYTPQHNSWVERENRELKEQLSELLSQEECSGERPVSVPRLVEALACARQRNNCARRWKRGRRTAEECDRESRVCYDRELRMKLAEQVRRTIAKTTDATCTARQRRQQERMSILVTLENGGWIRLTRGSKPEPWPLSETIK